MFYTFSNEFGPFVFTKTFNVPKKPEETQNEIYVKLETTYYLTIRALLILKILFHICFQVVWFQRNEPDVWWLVKLLYSPIKKCVCKNHMNINILNIFFLSAYLFTYDYQTSWNPDKFDSISSLYSVISSYK